MAQLESSAPSDARHKQHPLEQLLFYAGSIALLAIMFVETISVLGRHSSLPLIGAIEIIQASIIVVACTSTVIATLLSAHARVQLIINRLSEDTKAKLARVGALLSAIFFLGFAIGSFWLARDTWHAYEQSEVLHISYRPLRAIVVLAAFSTMCVFLASAFRHQGVKR
jgi:TRAP-type C4-dicarboxylate transport system permease small subunit